MHSFIPTARYVMCSDVRAHECEPTEEEVEAAAKAWMNWQFPGRSWDDAVENMKQKFRDGAGKALRAAAAAAKSTVH